LGVLQVLLGCAGGCDAGNRGWGSFEDGPCGDDSRGNAKWTEMKIELGGTDGDAQ
jgi:hypothetical protein